MNAKYSFYCHGEKVRGKDLPNILNSDKFVSTHIVVTHDDGLSEKKTNHIDLSKDEDNASGENWDIKVANLMSLGYEIEECEKVIIYLYFFLSMFLF